MSRDGFVWNGLKYKAMKVSLPGKGNFHVFACRERADLSFVDLTQAARFCGLSADRAYGFARGMRHRRDKEELLIDDLFGQEPFFHVESGSEKHLTKKGQSYFITLKALSKLLFSTKAWLESDWLLNYMEERELSKYKKMLRELAAEILSRVQKDAETSPTDSQPSAEDKEIIFLSRTVGSSKILVGVVGSGEHFGRFCVLEPYIPESSKSLPREKFLLPPSPERGTTQVAPTGAGVWVADLISAAEDWKQKVSYARAALSVLVRLLEPRIGEEDAPTVSLKKLLEWLFPEDARGETAASLVSSVGLGGEERISFGAFLYTLEKASQFSSRAAVREVSLYSRLFFYDYFGSLHKLMGGAK